MKFFACQSCGTTVYFDSTVCVNCGARLGYLPERFQMSALEPHGNRWKALAAPDRFFTFCANGEYDACNWLIPADGVAPLCLACRHNRTVPDLS